MLKRRNVLTLLRFNVKVFIYF